MPPDISIIIATKDREQILWQTVYKALEAVVGFSVEIIVVNDGSNKLTIPEDITEKINCFNNPSKGVSSARNFGVAQSKGSTLFFIDDDMWVNKHSIEWLYKNIIKNADAQQSVYYLNWVYTPELCKQLHQSKIGRYLLAANYDKLWGRIAQKGNPPASGLFKHGSIGSGSLVLTKEIFKRAGGYNQNIVFAGEDVELENKFKSLDISIYIVFDVKLQHNHQSSLAIESYLQRIYNANISELKAIKAGYIKSRDFSAYSGNKKVFFEIFRLTEKAWLTVLKFLPNNTLFYKLNNRLIGIISGLQKYKSWRLIYKNDDNANTN